MKKEGIVDIEGSNNLVRDIANMAIINKDSSGLARAKANKEKRLSMEKKVESLDADVREIKNNINKILDLLTEKK